MNPDSNSLCASPRAWLVTLFLFTTTFCGLTLLQAADAKKEPGWKSLPLITDGKVDPSWVQIGYGKFVVDDGAIRTEPDTKGLGLLVYKNGQFGNCQIKVVFKTKEERSNSGVYVRIASGILDQVKSPGGVFERDASGKASEESTEKVKAAAERDMGPWYAVHHGYEVQIAGATTGSIYSLAPAEATSKKAPDEWKTMLITLNGTKISVDLDDQHISSFDSAARNPSPRKQWHEPKREPKRPERGYIGLQTHDPGDIVWFKEISVRQLSIRK